MQTEHHEQRVPPRLARIGAQPFDLMFAGCKPERYSSGSHLFVQDDIANRVYGVINGTVEISIYSVGGKKFIANIEQSHSLIGEIAALDGGRRSATAICLTDCELVSLSRAQLFERIEQQPLLAREMIHLLCTRLRWVSGQLGDQALLGTEARLAKRLFFLFDTMSDAEGWIPVSQSDLAEYLGVTRESINKTLNEWRHRSLIETRRGALRIEKPNALSRLAEAEDD